MEIRFAQKGEIKILQGLNDEVFVDNHKYDPDLIADWALSESGRKYFTEILNNSHAICLIVYEGRKPIGYLAAKPKDFGYRKSKCLKIESMGVTPDYRSKHTGALLIKRLTEICRKRGFRKIYVNSYYKNKRAIAFYEKCDFKKSMLASKKMLDDCKNTIYNLINYD